MDEPPEKRDEKTGQFVVGTSARGRKKGARNRLHADFVVAPQGHCQERGSAAVEIVAAIDRTFETGNAATFIWVVCTAALAGVLN
jgi:hypothetical protein